jgi:hypothetical protein
MKLVNDVITHLLDPNIYYSRFSFLESGKEAINIKVEVSQCPSALRTQYIEKQNLYFAKN